MITEENQDKHLDEMLRAALADDLPDEVAAGMRNRIAAFRVQTAEEEKSPAALIWLFRKGLWAALAIGMLVAGFFLQSMQAQNPLADRVALIKTEFSNPEPGRPAELHSENRRLVPAADSAVIFCREEV